MKMLLMLIVWFVPPITLSLVWRSIFGDDQDELGRTVLLVLFMITSCICAYLIKRWGLNEW